MARIESAVAVQVEGALMSVVVGDVTIDFADELAHAAERTTPDRVVGDEREPALDLIEPSSRRWGCNGGGNAHGGRARP